MADRPDIPIEVRRDVLFLARHRCAVCGFALSLEFAHIIPWRKTHDHSTDNLIALCSNCHTQADKEDWGPTYLKRYRDHPFALQSNTLPPLTPEQRTLIDFIIASDPDSMTDHQRLRLVSMVAAYLGISLGEVRIVSVTAANSSRIRLEVPEHAAKALIEGFEHSDERLRAFLEEFELLDVRPVRALPRDSEEVLSTDPLYIVARFRGDVTVLDLVGNLTLAGSRALRDAIRDLHARGRTKVIINLREVSLVDSAGIGELIVAFTVLANAGGELKLANLTKKVHDLLAITKLIQLFEVTETEEIAMESFKRA